MKRSKDSDVTKEKFHSEVLGKSGYDDWCPTLIEQSKTQREKGDILQADTMELFAKYSDLLQYLPFENISGNAICFKREQRSGIVDMVTEVLVVGGIDIDIDMESIKKDKDCRNRFEQRIRIHVNNIERIMIKGNVEVLPKELDGLEIRCTNEQRLINNSALVNGDVLSLYKLDELIDSIDEPTHLLMNKTIIGRMQGKDVGMSYVTDTFGNTKTIYKNLPIMVIDKDSNYDSILPFTEPDPSGVPQCTSIYCLSLAKNGLVGLQNAIMTVVDLGKLDINRMGHTRIEWYITLVTLKARSIARLRYIKNGGVKLL